MWQAGATLHRGARASHCRGLSCRGAQAPDAQAQQLWLTGPAAPRYVGSSQTRGRTRVPCISRQILNHCATREAQNLRSLKTFLTLPIPYQAPKSSVNSCYTQQSFVSNALCPSIQRTKTKHSRVSDNDQQQGKSRPRQSWGQVTEAAAAQAVPRANVRQTLKYVVNIHYLLPKYPSFRCTELNE